VPGVLLLAIDHAMLHRGVWDVLTRILLEAWLRASK
jgi:hypothetical protein